MDTNLIAVVKKLLERPIAFLCFYFRICLCWRHAQPGILLDKNETAIARDGWFYKTQADWHEETCLTRTEQENARKRLREKGFMQEDLRGLPAKMWYRVDLEKVITALSAAE